MILKTLTIKKKMSFGYIFIYYLSKIQPFIKLCLEKLWVEFHSIFQTIFDCESLNFTIVNF